MIKIILFFIGILLGIIGLISLLVYLSSKLVDKSPEKITSWQRWNSKKEKWDHNHIEYGWKENEVPLPIVENSIDQKSWKKDKWKKELLFIKDSKIIVK